MDEQSFWEMIQATCGLGDPRSDAALVDALKQLPAEEIVAWNNIFDEKMAKSCRAELWGAARMIVPRISETVFRYFRAWLIWKGRAAFEAAIADADNLADIVEPHGISESGIHKAAYIAWVVVTGKTFSDPYPSGKEIKRAWHFTGEELPEESLRRRYSRLAALHLDDREKIWGLEPRLRRLFVCACCRQHLAAMHDDRCVAAIEVGERYADGLANDEELDRAAQGADAAWSAEIGADPENFRYTLAAAAYNAALPMGFWGGAPAFASPDEILREIAADRHKECAAQHAILSDLIFPAGVFVPKVAWGAAIVKMAQEIYRMRAFEKMPALGAAIRKAGVGGELASHCEKGAHVRGCWVVDILRGVRNDEAESNAKADAGRF